MRRAEKKKKKRKKIRRKNKTNKDEDESADFGDQFAEEKVPSSFFTILALRSLIAAVNVVVVVVQQ